MNGFALFGKSDFSVTCKVLVSNTVGLVLIANTGNCGACKTLNTNMRYAVHTQHICECLNAIINT